MAKDPAAWIQELRDKQQREEDEFFAQAVRHFQAKRGYSPARDLYLCGLCSDNGVGGYTAFIKKGDMCRKMPDSWMPESEDRYAHAECVEDLLEEIELKTGHYITL